MSEITKGNPIPDGVPVLNAFCPTGKGGGVDPSCGKGGLERVNRNGKPDSSGDWVRNPITFSEKEGEMELALDKEFKSFDGSKQEYIDLFATEETVQLDQLTSGQKIVEAAGIKHFEKSPHSVDKLPLVIQYGSELIVRDGNTRLSAKKVAGEQTAKVRLLYVSDGGI